LSAHLADKLEKENLHTKYQFDYNQQGLPIMSDETYNDFINETNHIVRKNKEKTIRELEKALNMFFEIFVECLDIFENEIVTAQVLHNSSTNRGYKVPPEQMQLGYGVGRKGLPQKAS
jgi:hypothetical protein